MNAQPHPHLDRDHERFRRSASTPAYFLGRSAIAWMQATGGRRSRPS